MLCTQRTGPARITTNAKYKSQDVSLKHVIVFERTQELQLLSCFQEQNAFHGLKQSHIYTLCFSAIA